jgi:plasmid stabilization system protein ParE
MRVRWTTNAANDLSRVVERIREDNPSAAQHVAQTIYKGVAELRTFPNRGVSAWPATRESLCLRLGPVSPYMKSSKARCMCSVSATRRRTGLSFSQG